jgi:hypothetical protein
LALENEERLNFIMPYLVSGWTHILTANSSSWHRLLVIMDGKGGILPQRAFFLHHPTDFFSVTSSTELPNNGGELF